MNGNRRAHTWGMRLIFWRLWRGHKTPERGTVEKETEVHIIQNRYQLHVYVCGCDIRMCMWTDEPRLIDSIWVESMKR